MSNQESNQEIDIPSLIAEGRLIIYELNQEANLRTHGNSIPVLQIDVGKMLRSDDDDMEVLSEISEIFELLMSEDNSRTIHYKFGDRIEDFLSQVSEVIPAPGLSNK